MQKRFLKESLLEAYTQTFLNALSILILIFFSVPVQAGGDESDIEVDLKLTNEKVSCGSIPDFFISIQNLSNKSLRILNIERLDLQHAATKLEVFYYDSMGDVMKDIGRIPSHFGEVTDNDYKKLKVGSSVQFDLGVSTMNLDYLPPEKYIAYIKYKPDPFSSFSKTVYESEKIIFEVTAVPLTFITKPSD